MHSVRVILRTLTVAGILFGADGSRSALAQCEVDKLTASDAVTGDRFGWSVGISGDYAVVGAYMHAGTGAAHLFERNGLNWDEVTQLVAPDTTEGDDFGYAVAISGNVAVVGARNHHTDGEPDSGAAYVFRKDAAGMWQFEAKLTAFTDPGSSDVGAGDLFGYSVAVDGTRIVVGAPDNDDAGTHLGGDSGSAYVFRYDGSAWVGEKKHLASDAQQGDLFGRAVSISGARIVVGAEREITTGIDGGAAYVFHIVAGNWQEIQKLRALNDDGQSDAATGDRFGAAVSIRGDTLVIGAYGNDDAGSSSGSAYMFTLEGTTWEIQQKLAASDAAIGDHFGRSVSISGDLLLVGAPWTDDGGSRAGSAYLFRRNGATWVEVEELVAGDAETDDWLGHSSAISGSYAILGAPKKASWLGAAYVYAVGPGTDCNENGTHDDCDIIDGTSPDTNGNGSPDECDCATNEECDDARFCTGVGTCVNEACQFSGDPCVGLGLLCDEANDECVGECLGNADCGDGNLDIACGEECDDGFTDDCGTCNADCTGPGTGSTCGDGEVCPEFEACDHGGESAACDADCTVVQCGDGTLNVTAGEDCEPPGSDCCDASCNFDPAGAACTDDRNPCTDDVCDGAGACEHPIDDTNDCDDGQFCNGPETCNVDGSCQPDVDPCPGQMCDEGNDVCVECLVDADCDGDEVCVNGICRSPDPTTWYVDDDNCAGPGTGTQGDPFCMIQDGIDVAINGDEVVVAPGTYNERIDFIGKATTLRSSDGAEVTTIDGAGLNGGVVKCVSAEGADTVLDGFTITGGNTGSGGGMYIRSSSPTVDNCTFTGNTAEGLGGGMYIHTSRPTVDNCTFTGNTAEVSGGGMYIRSSTPPVTNCAFSGNWADVAGGGMYNRWSSPTVTNCTFSGNTSVRDGGGMYNYYYSDPTVTNCTFSANLADEGDAMYNMGVSMPVLINCILWNHTESLAGLGMVIAAFSNVEGGWPGVGNIDRDPKFVDADGPDGIPGTEDDDLRLLPGSPCIDAGNNGRVPPDTADLDGDGDTAEPTPLDLDSSPRIVADPDTPSADPSMAAAVDMGAYEYQPLFPMVPYLDITPGTCPNRLSLRKQPLLQIAVVGSRSFNVSGVEVESLTLERADGVGGTAKPLAGEPGLEPTFKDVATPFEGELCDCHDRGRDGTNDLVVWFSTRQTAEALELQTSPTTLSVTLTLHGALLDGTPFKASDCVLLSAARPPPDVYPRRRKGRPR